MPPTIMVDRERAKFVFSTLIDRWRDKMPPFDRIKEVPSRIPRSAPSQSLGHARFLFVACAYMRGMVNSATSLDRLADLCDDEHWLLEPAAFVGLTGFRKFNLRLRVYELLCRYGLGSGASAASYFWVRNMPKLHRFWGGDPRLIYEKIRPNGYPYDELCDILIGRGAKKANEPNGFYGFRHKMASMLSYFYGRAGITPPLHHPTPADFHNFRIALATGFIKTEKLGPGTAFLYEHLGAAMRELTLEHCKDGDDILDLSDGIWHHSRSWCRWNAGNAAKRGKYKAHKTEVKMPKVRWSPGQVRAYFRTCGRCPLQDHCEWNIPSAMQYLRGRVMVSGPRAKPPDLVADIDRSMVNRRLPVLSIQLPLSSVEKEKEQASRANQLAMFE
jgi:hypothetical protein